jgi:hypothetical protein
MVKNSPILLKLDLTDKAKLLEELARIFPISKPVSDHLSQEAVLQLLNSLMEQFCHEKVGYNVIFLVFVVVFWL